MLDVVALGKLLIDFASKFTDAAGYPTMAANPGGAPGSGFYRPGCRAVFFCVHSDHKIAAAGQFVPGLADIGLDGIVLCF